MTRQSISTDTLQKHPGAGHRARLRKKFLQGGMDALLDYEVIELLLSLATPGKDCKQTAKDTLKEFKTLQKNIAANCKTLADEFQKLGFQLAYGGTNTHLVLIDLDSLKGGSGIPPKGDIASNILDICGITCNKNALPGDETGARPRGLRFGTTVLSQLGMGSSEMKKIAQLVHYVLSNIKTFTVMSHSGEIVRGKIDLEVMEKARAEVDKLVKRKASSTFAALSVNSERIA